MKAPDICISRLMHLEPAARQDRVRRAVAWLRQCSPRPIEADDARDFFAAVLAERAIYLDLLARLCDAPMFQKPARLARASADGAAMRAADLAATAAPFFDDESPR